MNVIGHHNVVAHQPFGCRMPGLLKPRVNKFIRQPGCPMGRAKRRPDNVWPSEPNVYAASSSTDRVLKWGSLMDASEVRAFLVGRARLSSSPGISWPREPQLIH
jgi:hypothetical protein